MGISANYTEDAFTRDVLELAKLKGWLRAHFRPARTNRGWRTAVSGDGAGFPDLVLIHRKRCLLIAAELKVGSNKMSPEQLAWAAAFEAASVPFYLWYPRNWKDIEAVLGG